MDFDVYPLLSYPMVIDLEKLSALTTLVNEPAFKRKQEEREKAAKALQAAKDALEKAESELQASIPPELASMFSASEAGTTKAKKGKIKNVSPSSAPVTRDKLKKLLEDVKGDQKAKTGDHEVRLRDKDFSLEEIRQIVTDYPNEFEMGGKGPWRTVRLRK